MKKLLFILLLFVSFGAIAQTYDTLPTGSKPYGNQLYITPAGLIIGGTGSAKFRVLGTKRYVDSLVALKQDVSAMSAYVTKTGTETLTNKTLTAPDINAPNITNGTANSMALVNGTINSTPIGASLPSTGNFTTANATASSTLQLISQKGAANGYASLGADGKVPNSQIPALAISETFPVASQAAMLALSGAEQGDVAVRSDISKSFILQQSPASTLSNWVELLTPTDAVQSVNGMTGNVTVDDVPKWNGVNVNWTYNSVPSIHTFITMDNTGLVGRTDVANTKSALGLTNATSNPAAFTAGRIPFTTGDHTLADNVALQWNNTTASFGIGTAPTAKLHVVGTPVASGTSGLNATNVLTVIGANGGNNTAVSGFALGGTGAKVRIVGGNGGTSVTSSGTRIGGTGGDVDVIAGNGGDTNTTGTSGNAGNANFQAGSISTGVPGAQAGKVFIKGGQNNIVGGLGGGVYLIPGFGDNNSSGTGKNLAYDGNIYLGATESGNLRGATVVGSSVSDGVNDFQVYGNSKFNGAAQVTATPSNSIDVLRLADVATGQTIGANTTGSASLWNGEAYQGATNTNPTGEVISFNATTLKWNPTPISNLKSLIATSLQDVTSVGNTTNQGIIVTDGTISGTLTYGGGQALIGTTSNHPLALFANNSVAATISANGNVGIGATPASGIKFQTRVGSDQNFGVFSSSGSVGISAFNDAVNANTPLDFNASKYNFKQGNIGIDNASPSEKLDVVGNAKVSGFVRGSSITSTSGGASEVTLNNSGQGVFKASATKTITIDPDAQKIQAFNGQIMNLVFATPSTTRTITIPDNTGTVALTSDITNAVASKANTNGGNTYGGVQTFTNGSIQALAGFSDSGYLNTLQSDQLTTNVTSFLPRYGGVLAAVPAIGGTAPTPTGTGIKGQVIITGGYRYECTATNTWVRSAIETTW
ncbi:hypothetical protein D3C86_165180 [compost metagenome]